MLAIPLKRSLPADLATPLHQYLEQTFGQNKSSFYVESFTKLTTAREKFITIADKKSTTPADISVVDEYLRAIAIIDAKFPVDEGHMKVNFVWHDAFQPGTKFQYNRLSAERAGALFNLAALDSRLAISKDRATADGLTESCDLFRTAGSIFSFLRESFLPSNGFGAATADLSADCLQMLENMMMAQAQVCLFQRGLQTNMSASVLAKLAKGCSELYDRAYRLTNTAGMKASLAPSWGNHLIFQSLSFKASSYKHYARVIAQKAQAEAEGFGQHIAWLQACLQTCREALQVATAKNLPSSVQKPIESMLAETQSLLNQAIDDNKNIYLELVPSFASVPQFEAKVIVHAQHEKLKQYWTGKMDLSEERDEDIFFGLLPVEVETIVSSFEDRVKGMQISLQKVIGDTIQNVRTMLKDANLPMLIEAGEKAVEGVPDETYARILAIVSERGGIQGLMELLDDNTAKNASLTEIVNATLEKLDRDQHKFEENKRRFGSKWSIPDASEAISTMRKDLLKFKGYLTEGGKNDVLLRSKLMEGEHAENIRRVSLSKEELDNLMPSGSAVDDDPRVEELRTKLRFSYIELDEKLAETSRKMDALGGKYAQAAMSFAKNLVERRDLSKLIKNQPELEELIEDQLSVFEVETAEMTSLTEGFTPLLSRVLDDSAKYMSSRKNNDVTEARVQALQGLEQGITEFGKYARNIDEGRNFYLNLMIKVDTVRNLVEDHVLSRDLISTELVEALSQGGAGDRPPTFAGLGRQASQPILDVPQASYSRPPQQQQPPPQNYNPPYPQNNPPPYAGYSYGNRPPQQPFPQHSAGYGGYPPQNGYGGYPQGGGYGYNPNPYPQNYGYPPQQQGYYGGGGAPPYGQPYSPPQNNPNGGNQGGQPSRFERMFSRRHGF